MGIVKNLRWEVDEPGFSPTKSNPFRRLKLAMPLQAPERGDFDRPGRAVCKAEVNSAIVSIHAEPRHIIVPLHGMSFIPIARRGRQAVRRLAGEIEWVSPIPGTITKQRD